MAFSLAGERIGSIPVNVVRLWIAWPIVLGVVACTNGWSALWTAPREAWRALLASGFAGYFWGDLCLFRAFVEIGPRRSLLVMSLAPPLTTLLATVWLGEQLLAHHYWGMALTLAGVVTVVGERRGDEEVRTPTRRGWWLALGGSLGQAVGMVLARQGVGAAGSAWIASAMRLTSGAIAFLFLALLRGDMPRLGKALRDWAALGWILAGTLAGPVAGVTLMLFALSKIPAGLAQTFAATTPILIIPLSRHIHRERIGFRALAGAVLAVGGVAVLFTRP